MDFCIILQDFFDIFNQVLVGSCEIFQDFFRKDPSCSDWNLGRIDPIDQDWDFKILEGLSWIFSRIFQDSWIS